MALFIAHIVFLAGLEHLQFRLVVASCAAAEQPAVPPLAEAASDPWRRLPQKGRGSKNECLFLGEDEWNHGIFEYQQYVNKTI